MARLKEGLMAVFQGLSVTDDGDFPFGDGAVTTGCRDLDRFTGGLHPGELTVVAGRPGAGKTGLVTALVAAAGRHGYGAVLLAALQWGTGPSALRLLAEEAGVGASRIAAQTLADRDWPRLTRAAGVLARGQTHVLGELPGGLETLRSEAGALAAGPGLGLVAVDHAGLVPVPGETCPCQALPAAVAGLRRLARDHRVPVVAVVELPAGPGGAPAPADLAARGIEPSAADVVWLVHRPGDPAEGPVRRLDIALHRSQGWQRRVRLLFDPETFRFHPRAAIPEPSQTLQ